MTPRTPPPSNARIRLGPDENRWSWSVTEFSLPRVIRATFARRETHRFLGRAHQGPRLLPALLELRLRVGVSDDARPGLHVHRAVFHQSRAQSDAGIHRSVRREIPEAAGVDAAPVGFQFLDDLH